MHSPYEKHLEVVYRILRYLKSTLGRRLLFKKGNRINVEMYTDVDWASSVTNIRSTSGFVISFRAILLHGRARNKAL